jgi:hypothetical protein
VVGVVRVQRSQRIFIRCDRTAAVLYITTTFVAVRAPNGPNGPWTSFSRFEGFLPQETPFSPFDRQRGLRARATEHCLLSAVHSPPTFTCKEKKGFDPACGRHPHAMGLPLGGCSQFPPSLSLTPHPHPFSFTPPPKLIQLEALPNPGLDCPPCSSLFVLVPLSSPYHPPFFFHFLVSSRTVPFLNIPSKT